mgnify:FL=1
MNILFAGTPENSSKILHSLIQINGINVKGVLTQPDKRGKRGSQLHSSHVSKVAENAGIKVFKEVNLNKEQFKHDIANLDIDLMLVVAYGKIIPEWLLSQPKLMAMNIHFSLLPKYRGASPIQSALINGDLETGITFMKMNNDLDAGEIINVFKCKIENEDNKLSLEKKLTGMSIKEIKAIIKSIEENKINLIHQSKDKITYCKKIKKEDGLINFNQSSKNIYNQFKAYIEWPESSFEHKDKLIKICDLHVSRKESEGEPGTIAYFDKTGISINTIDKMIVITNLQFPNKNKISSADAFNSYREFFS